MTTTTHTPQAAITPQPPAAPVGAAPVPTQGGGGGGAGSPAVVNPVSRARVEGCLRSAVLWTDELPRYANYQQSKADWWSIVAGVVATLTGLSVFPVLSGTSTTLEKLLVSTFAFVAGICALVPRVKNYGEMAGQARELSAVYGPVQGDLLDGLAALTTGNADDAALRSAITAFQEAKAKKDMLRYLPRGKRITALRAEAEVRYRTLTGG